MPEFFIILNNLEVFLPVNYLKLLELCILIHSGPGDMEIVGTSG
jgi:hypothetical protein